MQKIKLEEIYALNLNRQKWDDFFLNSEKKEHNFLILFSPLFAYAEDSLKEFVAQTKTLSSHIAEDMIENHVRTSLIPIFLPSISRVCVYEMQYASKYKFLKTQTPELRFNEFVQHLLGPDKLFSLLKKYSILKDIVQNTLKNFIQNSIEFFDRFSCDFSEIIKTFHFQNDLVLNSIKSSGDLHNSGKSVCIVELKDSKNNIFKLVYKPRSLKTDLAFSNFLHWFSKHLSVFTNYHQIIIEKENYGWCEYIAYLPCQNTQEIEYFYVRMGSLLAITHLLCSSDMHIENIIAHGAYPHLVDLECLLTIPFEHSDASVINRHSVFSTHILPSRILHNHSYNGIDISAISGDEGEEQPYTQMQWEGVGTDKMHLVRRTLSSQKCKNKPFLLNENSVNPVKYETFVLKGFKETFECIQKNKKNLLALNSPLQEFQNCQIRTVLRPTSEYGKLLYESNHPILLHDKQKRIEHFEWLKKNVTASISNFPYHEKILSAEMQDILGNNIPYFYCYANSCDLFNAKSEVIGTIGLSGFSYITKHFEQYFDNQDLEIQQILIENSYTALKLTQNKNFTNDSVKKIDYKRNYNILYSFDEIKKNALKIAKYELNFLQKNFLEHSKKIYWPSVGLVGKNAWTPEDFKYDIYNGLSGIMLTFGYAAQIFQDQEYLKTFQSCRTTLLNSLEFEFKNLKYDFKNLENKKLPEFLQNTGFYSGIGGYLYALGIMQNLFPDNDSVQAINHLLELAQSSIRNDDILDLVSGNAGFIMGLIALKDLIPQSCFHQTLQNAVSHILSKYPDPQKLADIPNHLSYQPLLGISHGISGFVLVLSQANQFLQNSEVTTWIQNGLAYENSLYNHEKMNWPDLRLNTENPDQETRYSMIWCHGAPGIGLSRIKSQRFINLHSAHQDLKNAVDSVFKASIYFPLNLCHGSLGNLDLILEASQQEWISQDLCQNYLSDFLNHAQNHLDKFQIEGKLSLPGLMTGRSGVAYQMMRVAYPNQVPSILC